MSQNSTKHQLIASFSHRLIILPNIHFISTCVDAGSISEKGCLFSFDSDQPLDISIQTIWEDTLTKQAKMRLCICGKSDAVTRFMWINFAAEERWSIDYTNKMYRIRQIFCTVAELSKSTRKPPPIPTWKFYVSVKWERSEHSVRIFRSSSVDFQVAYRRL